MAWTSPTTRATGDLITAAIWNSDNVNNPLYLYQRPAAKLLLDTAQSIPNNTATSLTLKQAYNFNTGVVAFPARGGTSTVITIPEAGVYQVSAGVQFATDGTGFRSAFLYWNGANVSDGMEVQANAAVGEPTILTIADLLNVAANDTIAVRVIQNRGSALNVNDAYIAAARVA